MRVIKKSEVREIIIGHVEFTLIFLFDDFLCKITIIEKIHILISILDFDQQKIFYGP